MKPEQARRALAVGTPRGRSHVAWYWWRQADSATDYGATLFRERLKYLLAEVWPLEVDLKEEESSQYLACLASCCGTEFESAVETITPLLTKISKPHMILSSFEEKDHPDKYPGATLALIDSFIGDEIEPWGWRDLRQLLVRISAADPAPPALSEDPRFLRLDAVVRRFE